MKAFLMCGGKGERLKELTKTTPKCMLPVNGEPMLGRWMRKLHEWGFEKAYFNINREAPFWNKIVAYVGEEDFKGAVYSMENGAPGTAHTLFYHKGLFRNDKRFAVIYSDVWTAFDMREMKVYFDHSREPLAVLGVYIPEFYEGKGIVTIKDGIITKFEEKPRKVKSPFIWAGLMVASPEIFSFMTKDMKDIATDLLPVLVRTGRVHAFYITEPLWDIGASPERYREVNEKVKRMVGGGS